MLYTICYHLFLLDWCLASWRLTLLGGIGGFLSSCSRALFITVSMAPLALFGSRDYDKSCVQINETDYMILYGANHSHVDGV